MVCCVWEMASVFTETKLLEGDSIYRAQSTDCVRVRGHLKRDVSIHSSHNIICHPLQPQGQWFPGGEWQTLAVIMTYPIQWLGVEEPCVQILLSRNSILPSFTSPLPC